MFTIKLDMYQATALAVICLLLGRFLVSKFEVLRKYCIPAPVVGGLVFAILHTIFRGANVFEFDMDMTLKNVFMTAFFCSVGFLASIKILKKAGIATVIFLALATLMCVIQNLFGIGVASIFGINKGIGIAAGSVPMVGGHGTAGAFGPFLEEMGVAGASAVAIASATFGLVAGCIVGGPIATNYIRKMNLKPSAEAQDAGKTAEEDSTLSSNSVVDALILVIIAIGLGTYVSAFIKNLGFTMPAYIGSMIVGAIIRNVSEAMGKKIHMPSINAVGDMGINVFLALAMIDLKLWQLADLALPMICILAGQTIIMIIYAHFVVFNVMGRNYDAAVMTAGFCGFGMGATPNGIANMNAVTEKHGPSPAAYMVVPLVGALFIDFTNALVITTMAQMFVK